MEESKPQRTVTIRCTNEKAIPYRNDSLAEHHRFRGGRKIPVVIMGNGKDQVGSLFVSALKECLSHSANYKPVRTGPHQKGLEFYVQLKSVDITDSSAPTNARSAISILIEEMGGSGSYPVPTKWYHKAFIVDRSTVNKIAELFFRDMDISFCNLNRSAGPCAAELLWTDRISGYCPRKPSGKPYRVFSSCPFESSSAVLQ
jgi:hypothetical protein